MRRAIARWLCLGLVWAGLGAPAAAEDLVGLVKTVEGGATVTRGAETLDATPGMELRQGDVLRTDGSGYVGLVFTDDTRLSLGPESEMTIDRYAFAPLEEDLSFIVRLARGTLSFLSGQIAKLAPEAVQLVLPAATIGVRGTHVLVEVD